MFCSILPREQETFDEIREFVLDKVMKYNGLTMMCKFSETFQPQQICEITAYPLGFLLYYESNPKWNFHGMDITEFADCKYDDLATIRSVSYTHLYNGAIRKI